MLAPYPLRLGYLGGYGHCGARVAPATQALAEHGITLIDIPYPGFEGRPSPPDFDSFLEGTARALADAQVSGLYASGLGGLLVLFLRRLGSARVPVIMQAPEWPGQARALHFKLLRHPAARVVLPRLVRLDPFRRVAAARYFERRLAPDERKAVFDGLAGCNALFDLIDWITPEVLEALQRYYQLERALLHDGIQVWWGGRDPIASEYELYGGEFDMRIHWPVELYDGWAHFPMVDTPQRWAAEVHRHFSGQPRQYAPA